VRYCSDGLRKKPERSFMERDMRTFIGMILGCVLTIGIVYLHDVRASSSVATSTTGVETRQIVNWDVAQANWNKVAENAQDAWMKLRESVRRATT
jgi:hypothetical protein